MSRASRLSGKRWNRIEDAIVERAMRVYGPDGILEEKLLMDGFPPFHEPLSERDQYYNLLGLRSANSDLYWNDPKAVQTFARLAQRFGPPPAPGGGVPSYPTGVYPPGAPIV